MQSEHSKIASGNFNLKEKSTCIFKCDCLEKQFTIKNDADTLRNMKTHIKKCPACVVNVDFEEFIFTRTGYSELYLVQNQHVLVKEKVVESSDRILRSNH